jgi:hypothetical protein
MKLKTKDNVLVRRRAKRGRPRKDEGEAKVITKPVFVARDPQGVKLFITKPTLSVLGVWEGTIFGTMKPMDPRMFVTKFRNARLPERGDVLEMKVAT